MRKVIEGGYIIALTTGNVGAEITEAEYDAILGIIHNKPTAPEGFDYRLKEDLSWELIELPEPEPTPEDDELSAEEALAIITGGASDD